MTQQSIEITDDRIYINLNYFIHKDFSFINQEIIIYAISKEYIKGKQIYFSSFDEENLDASGFFVFLDRLIEYSIVDRDDNIRDPNLRLKHLINSLKLLYNKK